MSQTRLLVATYPFVISESSLFENAATGTRDLYVSGIFQRHSVKNKNGRIYPDKILHREVDRFITEDIASQQSTGELDHPDSNQVMLERASHLITKLEWRGKDLYGTIKVLDTPLGTTLRKLIEGGVRVGISSRGMGSTKDKDGVQEVQQDYHLITWDVVSNPSTHGADLYTEVNESKDSEACEIHGTCKLHKLINNVLIHLK